MHVGRRLYYLLSTGDVILDTGERQGDVSHTTEDQDIMTYPTLQGIDRSTIGNLQLLFDEYSTEYQTGYISKVDPNTQAVTFTPYV